MVGALPGGEAPGARAAQAEDYHVRALLARVGSLRAREVRRLAQRSRLELEVNRAVLVGPCAAQVMVEVAVAELVAAPGDHPHSLALSGVDVARVPKADAPLGLGVRE